MPAWQKILPKNSVGKQLDKNKLSEQKTQRQENWAKRNSVATKMGKEEALWQKILGKL